MMRADLRKRLHIKNEKLVRALADLRAEGQVDEDHEAWPLVANEVDGDAETDGTASD